MPLRRAAISSSPKASRPHMPGYGLPTSTKGLLPWKWAEQRLKKSHNYWITTVRQEGTAQASPHTMVVWGLWLGGALLFSTGSQSRKARNLDANPQCVVCNERANEAVIVEGTAERVRDTAVLRRFLSLYERKYEWDMAAFEKGIMSGTEPVFAVRPRVVFGMYEKKFVEAATRWKFE